MGEIRHIPKAIADRYKPFDAREQDVLPEDLPYALPSPGITDPIHILALRGSLPADSCAACGKPNAYHVDTSGFRWIGCAGVPSRQRLQTLRQRPLNDVTEWGDPHPVVSNAIHDGLLAGCGQDVSYFYETLQPGERINLCRRLADLAVLAHLKEDSK